MNAKRSIHAKHCFAIHFLGRKIDKSEIKRSPFENDNPLGTLRFQGDYLYDKGENDELFDVSVVLN